MKLPVKQNIRQLRIREINKKNQERKEQVNENTK